jgi:anti-anti-sigma factor
MEQPFTLTTEVRDERLIITTSGYVNNVGGAAIAEEFQRHFAGGVHHVIINMALSRVVNSVGMSFLIEIIEKLGEVGGRLIFTNLDPSVDKMLGIMGLYDFAGKENTIDDALRSLAVRS